MKKNRGEGKMPNGFTVGVFLFLLIGLGIGSADKAEAGLADYAVINEVSVQGAVGVGGIYDDWVELYNPTGVAVNLVGWSIQKTSNSGGSLVKAALSGAIPANGYFLIVRNNASTTQSLKNMADILVSDSFSLAQNNIIFLVNDNVNITNSTDLNIVDFVGFGAAVFYEGAGAAPEIPVAESLARIPAGEDTNQNAVDFKVESAPTPTNASVSGGDSLGGTVLLTITPDITPAQNINSNDAQIVFRVNDSGLAQIKYGLDLGYASSTALEAVTANTNKTISLTGLACATIYHYVVYAANSGATENDTTGEAVFTTLPCGITLDSLVMTKASAKANNQYDNGWQWEFNITVWNIKETSLKMKFNQWAGAGALNAGANMQFSVNNGATWVNITSDSVYSAVGANISGIDNGAGDGQQVKIIVRMKLPVGTVAGYYNSSYGILTE